MSDQSFKPFQNQDGSLEQDERWAKVDAYVNSHLHPPSKPNQALLAHTHENSVKQGLPEINIYPAMGKFLALQCRIGNVKHALEVGTLGGYSAIWLASENQQLHVTSIEYEEKHAAVARENIAAAGLSERIEVIHGAGLDVLPGLMRDIEDGKRERFGFAFIDADKQNNWNYFDWAVKMGVKGMCVVVDNVVRKGKLGREDERKNVGVSGAMELVEKVGKDERVEATVMQTVAEKNYDGFLMAVVL